MDLSNLDPASVARALDDHDSDHEHYLSLTDGSVWTFVFSESTDETRKRHAEIRGLLGEAWIRIPSMTTQDAYEEIEDFVEGVPAVDVQNALFQAIERKGAFRNFRELLLAHPAEREAWHGFRARRSEERRDRFLQTLDGAAPRARPGGSP